MTLSNDPYELARYIKNTTKVTPVKAYIQGPLTPVETGPIRFFGRENSWTLFGDYKDIISFIQDQDPIIEDYILEQDRRLSAIPLLDYSQQNCRIEPGATIRDQVHLGDQAVIMMGAVINIGASVGQGTMIDMNAVLGARAQVGDQCHIGAGAVLAGVLEPPSAQPVTVEDQVLVGANAVILEGVRLGKASVVAAGAVVTEDVPDYAVVAGSPAKIVKYRDQQTDRKTELLKDLRG